MISKAINYYENNILDIIDQNPKITLIISGVLTSFCFAPYFLWPLLLFISFLPYFVKKSDTVKLAFKYGWIFGTSFFFINLNWIVIGVAVYIDEFWWALPFVYLALPSFLGIYIGILSMILFYFRKDATYLNLFSCLWVLFELLRSYLFTGFAWNLISYSFAFSDYTIQITSLIGSYGLSLIVIYTFSIGYYFLKKHYKSFLAHFFISISIWGSISYFGYDRLKSNPTELTNISIKIVQPSIKQEEKWDESKFWDSIEILRSLTLDGSEITPPNIILWPEAAVIYPPSIENVQYALKMIISNKSSVLVTGGITEKRNEKGERLKLYSSMYALKETGPLIFSYRKSHLVPFGEYIPYKNILPFLKKVTHGVQDFSPGKVGFIAKIPDFNILIRPLICYEVSFPTEVRMDNKNADVIFNATNDAWYGDSGGPYQHFYTTRMRAVENGLPIIRSANNGISAIIDPLGRIIEKTNLNDIANISYFIPKKLNYTTIYSKNGEYLLLFYILISIVLGGFLLKKNNKES